MFPICPVLITESTIFSARGMLNWYTAPFALPLGGAGTSVTGTTAAQAHNEKRNDPRMNI